MRLAPVCDHRRVGGGGGSPDRWGVSGGHQNREVAVIRTGRTSRLGTHSTRTEEQSRKEMIDFKNEPVSLAKYLYVVMTNDVNPYPT